MDAGRNANLRAERQYQASESFIRKTRNALQALIEGGSYELAATGLRRLIAHETDGPARAGLESMLAGCLAMHARSILAEGRDVAPARRLYAEALELAPEDAELHANAAAALWEHLRDRDEADRLFRRALELEPENGMIRSAWTTFQSASGRR
jgi:tetratricopeptide (TPR) repeat protein